MLVAAIDLAWLGGQMRERGLPPDGSLTVADRNGVILAREPLSERFVGTRIPDPFLHLVNAPSSGAEVVTSQDGTTRILGYVPVSEASETLYVSAGLSAEASYGAVARAARFGALLAVLGGLATLAAAWLVGSRVFIRPLQELKHVLEQWREGDQAARSGFRAGAGEIGALGAALDRMMDEIAESQEHRNLLAGELTRRVKNAFATVLAVAATTLNKPEPARDILPQFQNRIAALARTHEVLTRDRWERADLRDLASKVVQPRRKARGETCSG